MAPKKAAKATTKKATTKTTASASKVTKRSPAKKTTIKTKSPAKATKIPEPKQFKDDIEERNHYARKDQSVDGIVNEIGRRKLTKIDRELIEIIRENVNGTYDAESLYNRGDALSRQCLEHHAAGKPFNCHFKLYMKFELTNDRDLIPLKKNAEVPERSASRSPTKATSRARSKSPVKTSTANGRAASKSPTKATSPVKAAAASPSKATARAHSKSPVKATATSVRTARKSPTRAISPVKTGRPVGRPPSRSPSKSPSPIKTGRPASRAASRSPTKSPTRCKSTSPTKPAAMNRPMRAPPNSSPKAPASQAKKVTKTVSERRFNAKNDYGALMRRLENQAYMMSRWGRESPIYHQACLTAAEHRDIEWGDYKFACELGKQRARDEKAMGDLADSSEQDPREYLPDEEIDQIDEAGVVINQRDVSRKRKGPVKPTSPVKARSPVKVTRPTASPSPSKPTGVRGRGSVASPARRSPSKAPRARKASDLTPLPLKQPSKEGHGYHHSPTNPEFLMKDGKPFKKNTFFETMPLPEIWHRNMPGFFSLGETPYMERIVSAQIEEDLGKTHEEPVAEEPRADEEPVPEGNHGFLSSVRSSVPSLPSWLGGGSKKASVSAAPATSAAPPTRPSRPETKDPAEGSESRLWTMWDLPTLTAKEVDQAKGQPPRLKGRGKGPSRRR